MTKILDGPKELEKKGIPFQEKKKKKAGRPLFHVFKEADEAAALLGHEEEPENFQDDANGQTLADAHEGSTDSLPEMLGIIRDIAYLKEQVQRLRDEIDDARQSDGQTSRLPSPIFQTTEPQPALQVHFKDSHNPADLSRCNKGLFSCFGSTNPELKQRDGSLSWPQPPQQSPSQNIREVTVG